MSINFVEIDQYNNRIHINKLQMSRSAYMDFDSVAKNIRFTGGVFLRADFFEPWCISSAVTKEDYSHFYTTAKCKPTRLLAYHYILEGNFKIKIDSEIFNVKAGDLVVVPKNRQHFLYSDDGLEPIDIGPLIEDSDDKLLSNLQLGLSGKKTSLYCGFIGSDKSIDPVIYSLPDCFIIPTSGYKLQPWLKANLDFLVDKTGETKGAYSEGLGKVIEILFTESVVKYLADKAQASSLSKISALSDPVIARTIAEVSKKLDQDWTLELLAKSVNSSRSVLTRRFKSKLDVSPMQYIRQLKLDRATHQLKKTNKPIIEIAYAAGYKCVPAFNRAFKDYTKMTPTQCRN